MKSKRDIDGANRKMSDSEPLRGGLQKVNGKMLRSAALRGDADEVERLLRSGANAAEKCGAALKNAAMAGSFRCVELLLPRMGKGRGAEGALDQALREAVERDASEVLALILGFGAIGPSASCLREALVEAAALGRAKCLSHLLPFCDPSGQDSMALRRAAAGGHAQCVELLISRSDDSALEFEALRFAAKFAGSQARCVGMLLELAAKRLPCEKAAHGINGAAAAAAANGDAETLSLTLAHLNQQGRLAAIMAAAKHGRGLTLSLALADMGNGGEGVEEGLSNALEWAAMLNHEACVMILAPVANCRARGSIALAQAAANGNERCVRALLPWSDPLATRIDKALSLDAAGTARQHGHYQIAELIDAHSQKVELEALALPSSQKKPSPRI